MRNDADFAAYLAARWPFLLRSLLLIGCPPGAAEAIAQTGLARCYAAWDEVLETDDVDATVYRVVLDVWHRRKRPPVPPVPPVESGGEPGSQAPPRTEAGSEHQVVDPAELRRRLEARLAELTPGDREAVVLHVVAGLSETQVAEVLDRPVRRISAPASPEDLRIVTESIEVLAPPFDGVVAEAGVRRRRRRRIVVASVAAAVLVLAAAGWALSRSPAERPADADWVVLPQPNPVDVPWYAGGLLHLSTVAIRMPAVGDLAAVNDGAVFTDAEGTVWFAAGDGAVTEIGRTAPDARVAVSDQTDWAAWVDPSADVPRLVVHNLVSGKDTGLDLPGSGSVLAVDQARVYYTTTEGDFQWEPAGDPMLLDRTGLLDVESASRVYADSRGIEIVQAIFRVANLRPGIGALLSPGGNFVLSRAGDGSVPFRPLLYDARSGDRMRSGLAAGELALDATFGPNHTVSYLVAPRSEIGAPPAVDGNTEPLVMLRTCDLDPVVCHDVIPLARPGERPLLGH
ncbi:MULTISPECIES: sigma factor-like helix-turn-helix DNA-binding protein [unclassified Nocardioides]|uniref:sigma factor-like helix-turn-helix DNA-binding protein n=1 Tax=unclassified Nocardioides TaxID=2615069 RepID=UPI0006742ABB|nr:MULTISPECIES: sigma factor-like helix-turn-helix DNA-binding protein [unclassified Nocardioides]